MRNNYLKFDDSIIFGSPEHYFHYLWGYFLPSLSQIFSLLGDEPLDSVAQDQVFYFRACGPVMDAITNEILSLAKVNFKILEQVTSIEGQFHTINVPRWDIWLADVCMNGNLRCLAKNSEIKFSKSAMSNLAKAYKNSLFPSKFIKTIEKVKTHLIQITQGKAPNLLIDHYEDKYLILKRSPQPPYYAKDGQAEIPTYGTERRELLGTDEAAEVLTSNGMPAVVFEPGGFNLADQITVFKQCKGVIGIIGAEFANLVWMTPGCTAVMITPSFFDSPPVFKTIADHLGLYFYEINSESDSPRLRLSADVIQSILISDMRD